MAGHFSISTSFEVNQQAGVLQRERWKSRRFSFTSCCGRCSCVSIKQHPISGAVHQPRGAETTSVQPLTHFLSTFLFLLFFLYFFSSSLLLKLCRNFHIMWISFPFLQSLCSSLFLHLPLSFGLGDLNDTWKDNGISFFQPHLLYPSISLTHNDSLRITTKERSIFHTVEGTETQQIPDETLHHERSWKCQTKVVTKSDEYHENGGSHQKHE